MLQVSSVSKSFASLKALQDVSLRVDAGEIVGLIGPNGSGKSTLFDIISGFQTPDRGKVVFNDDEIQRLPPYAIAQRGLIRTFQHSEGGERMTAIENLMAAARNQIEANLALAVLHRTTLRETERANLARTKDILELLGLSKVANEYVGNLSGGQRKLIDIGRVMMAKPQLCLLDEPTAGVNPSLINVIVDALVFMRRNEDITLLVVEHNMRAVSELCDRVYVLAAGTVIAEGTPQEIQQHDAVITSYLGRNRRVGA